MGGICTGRARRWWYICAHRRSRCAPPRQTAAALLVGAPPWHPDRAAVLPATLPVAACVAAALTIAAAAAAAVARIAEVGLAAVAPVAAAGAAAVRQVRQAVAVGGRARAAGIAAGLAAGARQVRQAVASKLVFVIADDAELVLVAAVAVAARLVRQALPAGAAPRGVCVRAQVRRTPACTACPASRSSGMDAAAACAGVRTPVVSGPGLHESHDAHAHARATIRSLPQHCASNWPHSGSTSLAHSDTTR